MTSAFLKLISLKRASLKTASVKDAIRTMPQMDKPHWDSLNIIVRWLIATRAAVLLMTFSSAAIGTLLAAQTADINWLMFGLVVIGLLFAHATNNLINDLTDSMMGVDKDNYYRNQYGVHVLESKFMSMPSFIGYLIFTASIALAAGTLLVMWRGGFTLPLMLSGAFFVLLGIRIL